MLSTMLHIVILMIAIVGADKTCTKDEDISHLVQSLQSCANAITGLQPSSEIQEKYSPDAGLLQKIENISSTLANIIQQIAAIEENIATNKYNITQQIAAIEENIAINKYNITANKISIEEDIVTVHGKVAASIAILEHEIAENITSIEQGIAVNTVNIATNTNNIATNAASITTNADDIATNAASISTNADDIATNVASITTNADDIATNAASITTNADDIATNAASITTNADDIATNAASITTNADNIATNKEAIAKSSDIACNSSGWIRVAYLDMFNPLEKCPTGFGVYNINESRVRACGRQNLNIRGNCDSVTFSAYGISYSEVCGRVIGYQYGWPDGVHDSSPIDDPYVEGVSITHGSPRQHVWTLINGKSESGTSSDYCPCNTGSTASVPSFVRNDYFCESGTASDPTFQLLRPFHTSPLLIWIQSSFNPASKSKPDLIYFISSVNTTETKLDSDSN